MKRVKDPASIERMVQFCEDVRDIVSTKEGFGCVSVKVETHIVTENAAENTRRHVDIREIE